MSFWDDGPFLLLVMALFLHHVLPKDVPPWLFPAALVAIPLASASANVGNLDRLWYRTV